MASARVLIVDDDPRVLKFVERALSSRGYDTEATPSPRQALEIVKAKPCFDLLLSDCVMPEMSGPELAEEIVRVCPSTAVVLMSGYIPAPDFPPQASFIRKPFPMKDLFATVEDKLARSRELRNRLSRAREVSAELSAQSGELMREIDEVGRAIEENVRRLKENLDRGRDS
jgi:DNA-binding NtrC family response regulator